MDDRFTLMSLMRDAHEDLRLDLLPSRWRRFRQRARGERRAGKDGGFTGAFGVDGGKVQQVRVMAKGIV